MLRRRPGQRVSGRQHTPVKLADAVMKQAALLLVKPAQELHGLQSWLSAARECLPASCLMLSRLAWRIDALDYSAPMAKDGVAPTRAHLVVSAYDGRHANAEQPQTVALRSQLCGRRWQVQAQLLPHLSLLADVSECALIAS